MARYGFLLLLFSASLNIISAQSILIYGDTSKQEKGIVSYQMPDASVWMAGYISPGPLGGDDVFVVRLDSNGNELSAVSYYGTSDLDYPNNMICKNGQLIIVGESHNANGLDGFVLILDTAGTFISFDIYGSINGSEQFYDIKPTLDNGFIVGGFSAEPGIPGNDFLLHKFNYKGDSEWQKKHDLGTNDIGVTVVENPGGGYFMAGDQLQPSGNYNIMVIACDSAGDLLWDTVVQNPNNGGCKTMVVNDDELLIVGEMTTPTSSYFDIYYVRMSFSGQLIYQYAIPDSDFGDAAFDVFVNNSNSYYLTGYSHDTTDSNLDLFFMIIDSIGNVLYKKYFGFNGVEIGYDIQFSADHDLVITGFTNAPDLQAFLIFQNLSFLNPVNPILSEKKLSFYPYPVPVSQCLFIPPELLNSELMIYDYSGKQISVVLSGNSVDLSHLNPGLYIITFLQKGQMVFTSKIFKD